jgi:hypothetical protein
MKRLPQKYITRLWMLAGLLLFLVLLIQFFKTQQKLRSVRKQLQPAESQTNIPQQKTN